MRLAARDGLYSAGCFLLAFSVPFSVVLFFIATKPQLLALSLASSAVYLALILFNTCLWQYVALLHDSKPLFILVAVTIIELIRPRMYRLYWRFHKAFDVTVANRVRFPMNDLFAAVACGIGWALVHIFVYYVPTVMKSLGPGTHFDGDCEQMSTVTLASAYCPIVCLQHIALMLLFFHSFSTSRLRSLYWWGPFLLHLFASLWGAFDLNCVTFLIGHVAIVTVEAAWLFQIMQTQDYIKKIKKS